MDCGADISARQHNAKRCKECWAKRNRAKAIRWYNAHPDRVAARARAWVQAHRERIRQYQREWERAHRLARVCATAGCKNVIEPKQIKFCRSCRDWYDRNLWHTVASKRRRALAEAA